jgi:hypothetical protein
VANTLGGRGSAHKGGRPCPRQSRGADDPVVRQVAAAAFRRWKGVDPAHEIFREFIERERNNLLKEYHSDVHPLGEVVLVAVERTVQPGGGGPSVTLDRVTEIGENIYRPMLEAPWEGDDARDVLREAIDWWDKQLYAIDMETARQRAASHWS